MTCLIVLEDGYCGEPATYRAGKLPVCGECREWLLHHDWPYGIGRIESTDERPPPTDDVEIW